MSEPSNETSDSALSVPPKYLLDLQNVVPESIKKKCSKCDSVTMHQWVKVQPISLVQATDQEVLLEIMYLAKRIIMCQQCGTISVTK